MKLIWRKLSILAMALILVLACIPANVFAEAAKDQQTGEDEVLAYSFEAAEDDTSEGKSIFDSTWFKVILEIIKNYKLEDYRSAATTLVNNLRNQAKEKVEGYPVLQEDIDNCADELIKTIEEYTDRDKINQEIEKFRDKLIERIRKKSDKNTDPEGTTEKPAENNATPADNSTKPADNSSKIEDIRSKAMDTIVKRVEQANVKGDAKTAVLAAAMEATNAVRKANSEAEINKIIAALDQKIAEAKMTVKGKSLKALKKKKSTFGVKKAFNIKNAPSKLTFTKINKAGKSKIKVSKAGKITVKKGLKKGTYKVKVRVVSKATSTLKAIQKETTVKIKVK